MPFLRSQLEIDRCPHCKIDKPSMTSLWDGTTTNYRNHNTRYWRVYKCSRCGGVVTANSNSRDGSIENMYPSTSVVDESVPEVAREYLKQAIDSIHAPAGSVMLTASSVDAMLKYMGYKEGSLYSRIEKAKDDGIITSDMSQWAHEIRLDANEQRHADDTIPLPTDKDAERVIEFALALAQFLFVLPSRVKRGLEDASN